MALDVSTTQSTPLLEIQHREKNYRGSSAAKVPSAHLVHPGAVLCMMDLLPGVDVDPDFVNVLEQG